MAGKLVTIATFDQTAQAHIARNALEAAGISATLNNEESSALFGQVMTAFGGIKLVVREEDEVAAVRVLDDVFGTEEPVDEIALAAQAEAAEPEDALEVAQQTSAPDVEPTADSVARDKDARVAFYAAAISTIIVPSVIFALVMIRRASSGVGELSQSGRWNLRAAVVLAIWPLLVLGLGVLIGFGLTVLTLLFG